MLAAGLKPRSATDRWIPIAIDVDGKSAAVWVEGRFVGNLEVPAEALAQSSSNRLPAKRSAMPRWRQAGDPRLLPIDLGAYANDRFAAPLDASRVPVRSRPAESSSSFPAARRTK